MISVIPSLFLPYSVRTACFDSIGLRFPSSEVSTPHSKNYLGQHPNPRDRGAFLGMCWFRPALVLGVVTLDSLEAYLIPFNPIRRRIIYMHISTEQPWIVPLNLNFLESLGFGFNPSFPNLQLYKLGVGIRKCRTFHRESLSRKSRSENAGHSISFHKGLHNNIWILLLNGQGQMPMSFSYRSHPVATKTCPCYLGSFVHGTNLRLLIP